jgi:DNA segregation ATPase FtsK/SpoIIIE-like protein
VVAVDELADLMDVAGKDVEGYIRRIIQVGRGLGVALVAATQQPLAAILGSVVKANFPLRMVGKVASDIEAKTAAGQYHTGAERLPGKGAFLSVNGTTHRIQAYHSTGEEQAQLIGAIGQRWSGARAHYALRLDAPANVERVAPVTIAPVEIVVKANETEVPKWLTPAICDYMGKNGKAPSQRQVQELVQKRTGKMLPWPVVKATLQGATQAQPA